MTQHCDQFRFYRYRFLARHNFLKVTLSLGKLELLWILTKDPLVGVVLLHPNLTWLRFKRLLNDWNMLLYVLHLFHYTPSIRQHISFSLPPIECLKRNHHCPTSALHLVRHPWSALLITGLLFYTNKFWRPGAMTIPYIWTRSKPLTYWWF